MTTRALWCCGCGREVQARLTSGREVYPRRPDLAELPFWRCDGCRNWVGCHHRTANRTEPLGVIPTPELKRARSHIHALLDPLWQRGRWDRAKLYACISEHFGRPYHTAELRTVEEARAAYRLIRDIANLPPPDKEA